MRHRGQHGLGCLDAVGGRHYAFDSQTLPSGSGQVASSGNSVNALTGPLAELHVTGSFSLDPTGAPVFEFDADIGTLRCTLPPF